MTRKSGPRRVDHWLAGWIGLPRRPATTTTRSAQHPVVSTYVMAARTGSLLFVSDHGAIDGGRRATPVGWARSSPPPKAAWRAEAVTLNLLATLQAEVGDLSPSQRFEKVVVNSAPHYTEQHLVADVATDLLVRIFGNRSGRPARSAVVVAGLPLGFAVEVEDIVEAAPKTSGYPHTAPDLGFLPIRRVPGCSLPAVRSGNAISRSRARRSSVFLRCLRKRGTAGEAFAGSRRR